MQQKGFKNATVDQNSAAELSVVKDWLHERLYPNQRCDTLMAQLAPRRGGMI